MFVLNQFSPSAGKNRASKILASRDNVITQMGQNKQKNTPMLAWPSQSRLMIEESLLRVPNSPVMAFIIDDLAAAILCQLAFLPIAGPSEINSFQTKKSSERSLADLKFELSGNRTLVYEIISKRIFHQAADRNPAHQPFDLEAVYRRRKLDLQCKAKKRENTGTYVVYTGL